jgi:hypothetical protein
MVGVAYACGSYRKGRGNGLNCPWNNEILISFEQRVVCRASNVPHSWRTAMRNIKTIADFNSKAVSVRAIAKGIYDQQERRFLLRFVAYCENMAAAKLKTS